MIEHEKSTIVSQLQELRRELLNKTIEEIQKFKGEKEHAEAIKALVEAFSKL